jgi:Protein of unknown function (DUF2442)
MNTSQNKLDAIEKIIFEKSLKIVSIDFHVDLDMMLVVLNTGVVIKEKITSFNLLKNANETKLKNYTIIANGTGVHWEELDEDLSLKGFLQSHLVTIVDPNGKVALAA